MRCNGNLPALTWFSRYGAVAPVDDVAVGGSSGAATTASPDAGATVAEARAHAVVLRATPTTACTMRADAAAAAARCDAYATSRVAPAPCAARVIQRCCSRWRVATRATIALGLHAGCAAAVGAAPARIRETAAPMPSRSEHSQPQRSRSARCVSSVKPLENTTSTHGRMPYAASHFAHAAVYRAICSARLSNVDVPTAHDSMCLTSTRSVRESATTSISCCLTTTSVESPKRRSNGVRSA